MTIFVYAMFGAIVGSFLNVLILRHGTGRTVRGRSSCASCGRRLSASDLVPIVSWAFLRGRCRACGSAVSIQYPLVEATTALIFGIIGGAGFSPILSILACATAAVLVAISVYDIRHTIIPDAWVFLFLAFACALSIFSGREIAWVIFGVLTCTTPLLAMWLFSHGRAMGFGDVKLAAGLGAVLGPFAGIFALGFSFVLGSVFFLPMLVVSHICTSERPALRVTMKSEVPFGPFLIASFFIVWISAQYGISIPETLGLVW